MFPTPFDTPTLTPSHAPTVAPSVGVEMKVVENVNVNVNTTRNGNVNVNTPVVPNAVPAGRPVVESGKKSLHGIQSVACASASNAMPELRNDPLEGLDFDVMCEAKPRDCPNVANWVISCTACGGNALLCGTHLGIEANTMARHAERGLQVGCSRCGKVRPALELFTWRPL